MMIYIILQVCVKDTSESSHWSLSLETKILTFEEEK